ncbi:MAG: GNAT family N-acetyltransferase [Ferruginibacter sp.]
MKIVFKTCSDEKELLGILHLQKENLPVNLSPEEIISQGFVTVLHSLKDLQQMNHIEQHIIAKSDDIVIAYLLAMTVKSSNAIPILIPMFDMFSKIEYGGKPVASYQYIVVGQVCVDKNYRGQGILDECYVAYKEHFKNKYDFAITEIATANLRSINAHKRIGFKEVHHYIAPDQQEWSIVIWEW